MLGCGAAFLSLCLIGMLTITLGWNAFTRFGVAKDLDGYSQELRNTDLDSALKRTLILRIDALRHRVSEENADVSFFKWLDFDKRMTRLSSQRHLDDIEIEQLRNEIRHIEKALQ